MDSQKKTKPKTNSAELSLAMREYFLLAKPHWLFFVSIIFFVLLASSASVGEKFIFKVLLDEGANFAGGVATKDAFVQVLLGLLGAFIFITLVKSFSNWMRVHLINRLEGKIILELKQRFFTHILGLSYGFHTTHRAGGLISKMSRGARAIEGITDFFVFSSFPLIIQLVVVSASIFYFDQFSVVILFTTVVIFAAYVIFFINRQQSSRMQANNDEDTEKSYVSDVFTNIETVKYFGKELSASSSFHSLAKKASDSIVRSWDYERWFDSGQNLIIGAGLVLLVYFPLMRFINGELTIGTLAFIYTVYLNFADPLFGFVWGVRRFYESTADFQSLVDYSKIKNEVVDEKGASNIRIRGGRIDFEDVSFTYHKKKVIDGFTLTVKPREKIAIVGYSGSGKTTLVKLLYRFYDLESGKIRVDSKDISRVRQESLRSEMSIVPQEGILFNDTIYNNVVFAKPNATRAEVIAALKAARLHSFIQKLPEKESTIVGERGIKLSGGEKQRLSIARAILANKRILVLDEATSSLDSRTEHEIKRALSAVLRNKTAIIIAHRLSTILESDKIIVLDKGRIAQAGTHKELIRRKGIYQGLWNMQKGGYLGAK